MLRNQKLAIQRYLIAFVLLLAGYALVFIAVGTMATIGLFLVHAGINFERSADKLRGPKWIRRWQKVKYTRLVKSPCSHISVFQRIAHDLLCAFTSWDRSPRVRMSNLQMICFGLWAIGTATIVGLAMFNVKWPADNKFHITNPYCYVATGTMTAWITMWFV